MKRIFKDDLESLCYVLLVLANVEIPWPRHDIQRSFIMKKDTSIILVSIFQYTI